MSGLLLALCAWAAAAALAGDPRPPLPSVPSAEEGSAAPRRIDPRAAARPVTALAALCLAVVVHPAVAVPVGLVLWWLLPALAARLETTDEAVRLRALAAQLPLAAGLLSACLWSGASLTRSLAVVADSVPEPGHSVLSAAARTAQLGGTGQEIAAVLARSGDPGWLSLGTAIVRSTTTGAPLADLLATKADTALQDWFSVAAVRARSAAVRCVLPLALCYLPAFLLLGVAPLVAGFLSGAGGTWLSTP